MILIALGLSAATPADRWVHVDGGTNLYEEYVDRESIKRSGDKVTLWTRRDLALDERTVWNELEFDCRTRTETILAYIQDDGRSVVHNKVRPHREAALIQPGSVEEKIYNIACR
jgi:hypothetical protein